MPNLFGDALFLTKSIGANSVESDSNKIVSSLKKVSKNVSEYKEKFEKVSRFSKIASNYGFSAGYIGGMVSNSFVSDNQNDSSQLSPLAQGISDTTQQMGAIAGSFLGYSQELRNGSRKVALSLRSSANALGRSLPISLGKVISPIISSTLKIGLRGLGAVFGGPLGVIIGSIAGEILGAAVGKFISSFDQIIFKPIYNEYKKFSNGSIVGRQLSELSDESLQWYKEQISKLNKSSLQSLTDWNKGLSEKNKTERQKWLDERMIKGTKSAEAYKAATLRDFDSTSATIGRIMPSGFWEWAGALNPLTAPAVWGMKGYNEFSGKNRTNYVDEQNRLVKRQLSMNQMANTMQAFDDPEMDEFLFRKYNRKILSEKSDKDDSYMQDLRDIKAMVQTIVNNENKRNGY